MNEFSAKNLMSFYAQFKNCDITIVPFFNDGLNTYFITAKIILNGHKITFISNDLYDMNISINDGIDFQYVNEYTNTIFDILVSYIDFATNWNDNVNYPDITYKFMFHF